MLFVGYKIPHPLTHAIELKVFRTFLHAIFCSFERTGCVSAA